MNRWEVADAVLVSELRPTARHVMHVLLAHADTDTATIPAEFTPSTRRLRGETGLSSAGLDAALTTLREAGWVLAIVPTRAECGRGVRTAYVLQVPAGFDPQPQRWWSARQHRRWAPEPCSAEQSSLEPNDAEPCSAEQSSSDGSCSGDQSSPALVSRAGLTCSAEQGCSGEQSTSPSFPSGSPEAPARARPREDSTGRAPAPKDDPPEKRPGQDPYRPPVPARSERPRERCAEHYARPTQGACRACMAARELAAEFDRRRDAALRACPMCTPTGELLARGSYALPYTPYTPCDHETAHGEQLEAAEALERAS